MERFFQDVRYCVRTLLKAPGFTIMAVMTLALGIGANTAMFSVVNAVLLRPLPFPQPDRLMSVATLNTKHGSPTPNALSYPDYIDYRKGNRTFEELASYYESNFSLTGDGEAVLMRGEIVGSGLFKVLGVQPALGRSFLPEEDEPGHAVAMISNQFWKTHYNGDRNAIGRTMNLGGKAYTLVGVMPEGFQFPIQSNTTDVWVTIARDFEVSEPGEKPVGAQRGAHFLAAIGRLKAGVSQEQAQADVAAIAKSLSTQFPDSNLFNSSARVESLLRHLVGNTQTALTILLATVGCVLLIACANIANLVLVRSSARSREFVVRAALGASRWRMVQQLITESVVLSIAGAAVGAVFASWAVGFMVKLYPENLPRVQQAAVDWRVLTFTVALAITTGVLFGMVPALQASRPNLNDAMREGGRGASGSSRHTRVRSLLVIGETALGVMLLIGAGLLIRSLNRLSHVDLGFDPHNVITANFGLSETRYKGDKEDQFVTELLTRIRTIPGVVSVGATQQLPLANDGWGISFDIVERRLPPSQQPSAGFYNVTAGLLETMKIPIVAGRSFDEHDTRSGNPVMIINQAFAKKYFPNENPIGKQIEIGAGDGKDRQRWKTREIIGVVGNIRNSDLTDAPNPAYFVPYPQLVWGPPTLAIRTQGDPNRVVEPLHKILASMERDAPLYDIKTMEDYLALDLGRAKFQTVLLGFFASIALLLTAVGLYGVIAHAVALRTHEFGIRMALGASRTEVLAMVIKSGTLLTGIGLAIGVVGALALSRVLKSLLFDIGTRDPLTFASVCGLLAVVALLACYVPARRATSIDPMVALRVE